MHKNDDEILSNKDDQLNQLNENIYDQIKIHKRKYYLYILIGLIFLIIIILIIILIITLKSKSKDLKSDSEQQEEEEEWKEEEEHKAEEEEHKEEEEEHKEEEEEHKEEEEEEEKEKDKVEPLPEYGYNKTFYSGYLKASETKNFHYFYLEAEEDPTNKPLLLWLGGGPGCSSLTGWGMEHGPYTVKENEKNFTENIYSWNKEANIIYLESPGEVGFSYINSTDPNDFIINDNITANDNFEALKHFFKKFSELKNKAFYIGGESYAGVYVPRLAELIINYNNNITDDSEKINLIGILIGNGVVNPQADISTSTTIDFMFFHHLISIEQRMEYLKVCVNEVDEDECLKLKEKLFGLIKNLNIYDILQKCNNLQSNLNNNNFYFDNAPWLFKKMKSNYYIKNEETLLSCIDVSGLENFLRNEDVQKKLHTKKSDFRLCNETVFENYQQSQEGSFEALKFLINNKIKILIYSGDTDLTVPFNGNQLWIKYLNLTVKENWNSWKMDKEDDYITGYKVVYDELTFVTIRGVGQMIPQWKPKEALYVFTQFIEETSKKN